MTKLTDAQIDEVIAGTEGELSGVFGWLASPSYPGVGTQMQRVDRAKANIISAFTELREGRAQIAAQRKALEEAADNFAYIEALPAVRASDAVAAIDLFNLLNGAKKIAKRALTTIKETLSK